MKTKVTFNVADVLPKLQQAASIVSSKNSMPIFGDLLLTFEQGSNLMKIEASDSETWIELNAPVEQAEARISIGLNANDFCKALSNLKGKIVEMTIDDEKYTIVCNYGNGEFKMSFDDAEKYPHAQFNNTNAKSKDIVSTFITNAIRSVSFASASNDMLRPQLSGVRFDFNKDGIVSAGTDGQKLARYIDRSIKSDSEAGFTICRKAALLLNSTIHEMQCNVHLEFNESTAVFRTDSFKITTRLTEGRYPNYNAVIPTNYTKYSVVNTRDLIYAIKRVSQMSNKTSMLMKIVFSYNAITLNSEDYDFSRSASEVVQCDYNHDSVTIGFNGAKILEILSTIECENVRISISDCSRPALFSPEENANETDFIALLMPMMLN